MEKILPNDLSYGTKVARYDIGSKMMAAIKKLPWDKGVVLQYGWKGNEMDIDKEETTAEWTLVSGLAARLFNEHLASFPEWTYSTLTVAKGPGLNKLLVQGGAGGSAVWCRSRSGSVLMKIGGSRKFSSNDRIIDFHSRAPASIHSRDEEAIAVLAHNLSREPFENPDIIRKLTALGLVPAPNLGDEEEDDITEPESEEEDLFTLARGPGSGIRNTTLHLQIQMFAEHKHSRAYLPLQQSNITQRVGGDLPAPSAQGQSVAGPNERPPRCDYDTEMARPGRPAKERRRLDRTRGTTSSETRPQGP